MNNFLLSGAQIDFGLSLCGIMISLAMDKGHAYTFRGCMISCNLYKRVIYSYAYTEGFFALQCTTLLCNTDGQ